MKRKILIVEDNISLSQMQKDWFSQAGYDAVTAMNEPAARSLIRKIAFDLILSDVRLPEGDGISLLEWLRKEKKDIPFIITTEYVSVSDVVRTIKLGAIDYLPKPVHREHLLELTEDVFQPMVTVRKKEKVLFHRTSPKIEQVEKYARLVAPSEMAVMILGANGTGKESVAQSIHQCSERWNKNVRELQNRVKRSVLVSESPVLEMEGLDTEIHQHDSESTATPAIRPLKDEAQEKMNIINALKACNGHREQAASMLKINPATLYRKMKKYGLN